MFQKDVLFDIAATPKGVVIAEGNGTQLRSLESPRECFGSSCGRHPVLVRLAGETCVQCKYGRTWKCHRLVCTFVLLATCYIHTTH